MVAKNRIKTARIKKGIIEIIKLITDHNIIVKAPTLNKIKGANKKNSPQAKIPFTARIRLI